MIYSVLIFYVSQKCGRTYIYVSTSCIYFYMSKANIEIKLMGQITLTKQNIKAKS